MQSEGIFMSKKEQFEYRIIYDFITGKLKRSEASELIGKTPRTITRVANRVRKKGMLGVKNGNIGRKPSNKISHSKKKEVLKIVQDEYFDFNLTHCLEKLHQEYSFTDLKYGTLRRWCHSIGLVKRKHRRSSKVRKLRARMPNSGLMLQMDGSPHRWNGKDVWCLIAAIDDANSEIPYAEFFLSEDTLNCMTVMQRIIEAKGIPETIYVDKAGCLGGGKRSMFNQFRNACDELGVKIIFASSPQAKGRIERVWDTFQDRLIPEMRLKKVTTMPRANEFLQEVFIPGYWKKNNMVPPTSLESRYRPLPQNIDLNEIFCIKEYRTVKADHTFSYKGTQYLIESDLKYSIYKQQIEIKTYQNLKEKFLFAGKKIQVKSLNQHQLKQAA
jgi:transposase